MPAPSEWRGPLSAATLRTLAGCDDACTVTVVTEDRPAGSMVEVQHAIGPWQARIEVDRSLVRMGTPIAVEIVARSMRSAHAIVADREARKQGRKGRAHVLEL